MREPRSVLPSSAIAASLADAAGGCWQRYPQPRRPISSPRRCALGVQRSCAAALHRACCGESPERALYRCRHCAPIRRWRYSSGSHITGHNRPETAWPLRMTCALTAAKVRNLGEDLDQWLRLCCLVVTLVKGFGSDGACWGSKAPRGTKPFHSFCTCCATPMPENCMTLDSGLLHLTGRWLPHKNGAIE